VVPVCSVIKFVDEIVVIKSVAM
jgi:hypothetical protein